MPRYVRGRIYRRLRRLDKVGIHVSGCGMMLLLPVVAAVLLCLILH